MKSRYRITIILCVYVYIHMYMYMHLSWYIHVCAYVYTSMYIYIYTLIYMFIHINIHEYMHIPIEAQYLSAYKILFIRFILMCFLSCTKAQHQHCNWKCYFLCIITEKMICVKTNDGISMILIQWSCHINLKHD